MAVKSDNTSTSNQYRDNWNNQTELAHEVLHQALSGELTVTKPSPQDAPPEENISTAPVLPPQVNRSKLRVLFVTQDTDVLLKDSESILYYRKLSLQFDELHILLVRNKVITAPPLKIANNIWVYQVGARFDWGGRRAAILFARSTMIFNDSVRPDLVVATDPARAGFTAEAVAEVLGRKLQVHVTESFFIPDGSGKYTKNFWQRWRARSVLKQAESIRVNTVAQMKQIQKFTKNDDIVVLPQFYNLLAMKNAVAKFDLHDKYPDFAAIILTFADLVADSPLHDVITAVRSVLLENRIGLVVIGDGPAQRLFEEKVRLLGIKNKVVFVREIDDIVSYFKTANMLVESSTKKSSEINTMRAIAAGLPIVAYETDLRRDLLTDGKSAFLCKAGSVDELSQRLVKFLSDSSWAKKFRQYTSVIAESRLQEDEAGYYQTLRDTIEKPLSTE